MKKEEENGIIEAAITVYGFDKQLEMLVEECSELIQACMKLKRGKDHNVAEEMADVQIMIDQISIFFKRDIEEQREEKLIRLRQRVRDAMRKRQLVNGQ